MDTNSHEWSSDPHGPLSWTGFEAEGFPDQDGYVPPVKETLPAKYRGKSELELDVKDGDNELDLILTK